ncbi:MAG TPA: penicillin-binding protein 2 [Candidatus Limnocylindria bacterium]|nr:penicillin-binding protein 2 [Candidatus Limnocylindria bacterium]
MLARTDSRARALFLLIITAMLATLVGGRLVFWQVIDRDRVAAIALNQLAQNEEIPAERGEIRDINGVLLATSVEVQSVYAIPPTVKKGDPESAATLLGAVLGMDSNEMHARLTSKDPWVWLRRRIDAKTAERIDALNIPGVGMLPETQRVYPISGVAPETTLGAQLLGFVNVDGAGQYGVEGAGDALLAGLPGSVSAQEDVIGRRIADSVYELRPPVDGADLRLTLDAGLQHILETAMWSTYEKNLAQGVTGLVMDVHSGAIMAMASFPSFDANTYGSSDPALFTDPAVSRQYEPGSVMKAFTVAAALDAGVIDLRTTVEDDNNLRIGKIRIQNADRYTVPYGHGEITAGEVLNLSNNVGAAKIGLLLGRQRLYEAFKRFGFGTPTGIDIAAEASGVVWNPDGPNASGDLTAAQNSFGQGLSVTAVQLVAAYSAIANGGTLVTPHVIAGWTGPDGVYHATDVQQGERIMREETATTMVRLLTEAVDIGRAQPARIPGYSIAGKTGTAEVAGPETEQVQVGTDADGKPIYELRTRLVYQHGWIDSSFISIMPATDPQFVTLILIHRPVTWGLYKMAQTPVSVFRNLAPQIFDYLAIAPDRIVAPVAAQ